MGLRVLIVAKLSLKICLKERRVQILDFLQISKNNQTSASTADLSQLFASQIRCYSSNASSPMFLRPPVLPLLLPTKPRLSCQLSQCLPRSELWWQTCLSIFLQRKGYPSPILSFILLTPSSVLFSYWISTLDLIQQMLNENEISHTRIDGKTSLVKRSGAMRLFQTSDSVRVILVSITCGGAG